MRYLKFILSLLVTVIFILILDGKITTGLDNLPPLGSFFSPFTGFWQNAEPTNGYSDLELKSSGITEEIEIIFDERLVPHIFAQNAADAMFAQGYLHAKYRLWQMDISTRATGGRLAEILGPRLIEFDRLKRRQGFRTAAETSVRSWQQNPRTYKLLEAYSNGVNSFIKELSPQNYPLEYKLMNFAPEAWTTFKTALFIHSMNNSLCRTEFDIEETNVLNVFGKDIFDFLFPEYNPKQSPVIPEGTPWPEANNQSSDTSSIYLGKIHHKPYPKPPANIGSNNWAVSGSKTASGFPILCNDPHLNLTLPSTWYEIQIQTPEFNSYGVSLPGVPGIIIGFNENIAWGETNVGQDILDWYRIHWVDSSKTQYFLDGKPTDTEKVVEVIKVRNQEDILDTVNYTYWGPVVYEDKGHPYQDLAMHWMAQRKPHPEEVNVFLHLSAAKSFADFSNALENYYTPPQNFVFAAKDGDIALRIQGRFPIKEKYQGRFIMEGDSTGNDWKGVVPSKFTPMVKNPPRGFVSSANQHSTTPDYPFYYYGRFNDYRGRYLNRKLEEMNNLTVEDMMSLQNDNYSLKAEEALPLLLKNLDSVQITQHKEVHTLLKNWDYRFNKTSKASVIFDKWWQNTYRLIWDEILDREDDLQLHSPETWRTIEIIEKFPENQFFDILETEEKETASEVITKAFGEVVAWMDTTELTDWKDYMNFSIPHLGRIDALSISDLDMGGYDEALNAMEKSNGPSWKMIIEMGPEPKAFGIYPGGQSGNPGSPFYSNSVYDWAKGEYYQLKLLKNKEDISPLFKIKCSSK